MQEDQSRGSPGYFRRKEAASYLTQTFGFPVSRAWLASMASTGGGPIYRKAGRVPLYTQEDLDAWAKARLSGPFRASGIPATAEAEE